MAERPLRILVPLPDRDFDTTESSVVWDALDTAGHEVVSPPSTVLWRNAMATFDDAGKPIGAVCHGVLVPARARNQKRERACSPGVP
jgi:hypothetical protein